MVLKVGSRNLERLTHLSKKYKGFVDTSTNLFFWEENDMKKTWKEAILEEIKIKTTAFGCDLPNLPDSEKTQTTINGKLGWEQKFGFTNAS